MEEERANENARGKRDKEKFVSREHARMRRFPPGGRGGRPVYVYIVRA